MTEKHYKIATAICKIIIWIGFMLIFIIMYNEHKQKSSIQSNKVYKCSPKNQTQKNDFIKY